MTSLFNFQWFVAQALDQLLFSLAEGAVLIFAVSLLLRLFSRKNSRTRFTVWFSTLIAIAILPLARAEWRPHVAHSGYGALVTLPSAWAIYFALFWAVVAGAGLIRLVAGLWRLGRLRRSAKKIDSRHLGQELHEVITDFRRRRPVSILVSERAQVPGAIGFLRPAILLPAWLAENPQGPDVKYVVLHELAHLERWDDWTNLAQRLIKAMLFFHPGVWWIERKLFQDREMACDDAVLERTGSARSYAQCLARVAEKSFLHRQLALATAAVDRVSQLSQRVKRVLDSDRDSYDDRPHVTRAWRPAVPMVSAVALLCAVSVSRAPNLVELSDSASTVATLGSTSVAQTLGGGTAPQPVLQKAALRIDREQAPSISKIAQRQSKIGKTASRPRRVLAKADRRYADRRYADPRYLGNLSRQPAPELAAAPFDAEKNMSGLVLVVVSDQMIQGSSGQANSQVLQIKVWEVRRIVLRNPPAKPIPRRT